MGDAAIFVVGPSRAGNTLMRAVLNGLPDVWLADETHYFEDLRLRLATASGGTQRARILAECQCFFEHIGSARYEHLGKDLRADVPKNEAKQALASGDDMFAAYCRTAARAAGARVWGEKTPRHVFAIESIISAFPQARILCMVRDARAVVASYRDWPEALAREDRTNEAGTGHLDRTAEMVRRARSYNILVAALMWRAAVNSARKAQAKHGNAVVRLVRYEDLVRAPETTLRDLTAWLGLPFHQDCLRVPMQNSSTVPYQDAAGIVTGQAERWRTSLGLAEIGLIEWVTKAQLLDLGYTPTGSTASFGVKIRALSVLPWAIWRAGVANRRRMGGILRFIGRRIGAL